MRVILITALIIYHSFCMYSGVWNVNFEVPENQIYYWISRVSVSCLLEGFVFLAGFLFYHKMSNELKKSFRDFIIKKFKHLILPCWFFGVIYVLLLKPSPITYRLVYDILSGYDHLWFLPMLFWCYCFAYLIHKGKYNMKVIVAVSFVFALLPRIPNPFQIGAALHYLSYFIVGMYMGKEKRRYTHKTVFAISSLCYLVLMIMVSQHSYSFIKLSSIVSLFGSISLFIFSNFIAEVCKINNKLISLNTMCYGIYIIHQFILLILYVHTDMPHKIGFVCLPWIGFIMTYIGSILIVSIFISFKTRLENEPRFK